MTSQETLGRARRWILAELQKLDAREGADRDAWLDACARALLAAVRAARMEAFSQGVEMALRMQSRRSDWPLSWDAGFPGIKVQALVDWGADAGDVPEPPR